MSRSLFVRQMVTYLVIILTALAILAILLSSFFRIILWKPDGRVGAKAKPYPNILILSVRSD